MKRRPGKAGAGVLGSKQQRDPRAPAKAAGSETPWLSRKDWASGVMRDNVGLHLDVYVVAFMGIVFLAAAFGFYHERSHLAPQGGYGPYIPLVVSGLLGAGLTLKAVHLTMSWVQYGGSRL